MLFVSLSMHSIQFFRAVRVQSACNNEALWDKPLIFNITEYPYHYLVENIVKIRHSRPKSGIFLTCINPQQIFMRHFVIIHNQVHRQV